MIAPTNPTIPAAALSTAPATTDAKVPAVSCWERVVFTSLLGSATFWLLAGSFLLLVASLKLMAPGFLAGCPVVTFGRIQPAATNALLFGFASQAALAIALWLIVRLGRGELRFVGSCLVGAKLWNIGLVVGLIEIFSGHTTGFEGLEMPRTAAGILLSGYLLVALSALQTLRVRTQRELAVCQWFLVGALFAFPWLYSASVALLMCVPVRGVVQVSVNAWFNAGFSHLWLGAVALAVLYQFLPRLSGAASLNRSLSLFGFWSLFLVGAWTGILPGTPLPAWLVSLSGAMAVGLLAPTAANAMNLLGNVRSGLPPMLASDSGRFFLLSALAYVLWNLALILGALPATGDTLRFSGFETTKFLLGFVFVGTAFFGVMYQVLPEVLGRPWPLVQFVGHHWSLSVAALAMAVAPIWNVYFVAPLLILLGAGLFAANFVLLVCGYCREVCFCEAWFVTETPGARAGA